MSRCRGWTIALALLIVVLTASVVACSPAPNLPSAAAHASTPEASANVTSLAGAPPPITPAPRPPALPAIPPTARPNPNLTPGDVFAGVGAAQICVKGYSSKVRDVSTEEKDQVYAEYGIFHHAAGEYEVDHLVPLELGGSNDIKNLWPEPALPTPGFHQKDVLENTLHDLLCAGRIPLATAQHAIASDWYAVYLYLVRR